MDQLRRAAWVEVFRREPRLRVFFITVCLVMLASVLMVGAGAVMGGLGGRQVMFVMLGVGALLYVGGLCLTIAVSVMLRRRFKELGMDVSWCRECGYDLTNLASCPECGAARPLPAGHWSLSRSREVRRRVFAALPRVRRLWYLAGVALLCQWLSVTVGFRLPRSEQDVTLALVMLSSAAFFAVAWRIAVLSRDEVARVNLDKTWCRRCGGVWADDESACPGCGAEAGCVPPRDRAMMAAGVLFGVTMVISAGAAWIFRV